MQDVLLVRLTLSGGIAHAQSRTREPCIGARCAFSSLSSVVPTQIMHEFTSCVHCSTSAGSDGSAAGTYFVSSVMVIVGWRRTRNETRRRDPLSASRRLSRNGSPAARLYVAPARFGRVPTLADLSRPLSPPALTTARPSAVNEREGSTQLRRDDRGPRRLGLVLQTRLRSTAVLLEGVFVLVEGRPLVGLLSLSQLMIGPHKLRSQ